LKSQSPATNTKSHDCSRELEGRDPGISSKLDRTPRPNRSSPRPMRIPCRRSSKTMDSQFLSARTCLPTAVPAPSPVAKLFSTGTLISAPHPSSAALIAVANRWALREGSVFFGLSREGKGLDLNQLGNALSSPTVRFRSPRSNPPMYVQCMPITSAKASWHD
jgi:hypothetical protein